MTADADGAVVVGYDGSIASNVAVEWAAKHAERQGVDLVVVHAYRRVDWIEPARHRALEQEQFAAAMAKEGAQRAHDQAPGVSVRTVVRNKGAAAAIEEISHDARLVVVGHRGRSRLTEGLLGSVAFAASAHATCPVVVVRGDTAQPGPDRPVVVGDDGSEPAIKAVDGAAALAAEAGVKLVVVAAWRAPEPNPWMASYLSNPNAAEEAQEAAKQAAQDIVELARDRVRARRPELDVEVATQQGRAERVLADASEGAGLLVVGSRGHSDLASLLLGSVSRAALHNAQCPVAVIR